MTVRVGVGLLFTLCLAGIVAAADPIVDRHSWQFEGDTFAAEFESESTLDAWTARDEPSFQPVRQYFETDRGIHLENRGGGVFQVTGLSINGRGPAFSLEDVYKQAGLTDDMSEQEKVVRLHRFMLSRRFHGMPRSSLTEHVLGYLNITGEGHCNEDVMAFQGLAGSMGVQSMFTDLSGHVVAEYLLDGRPVVIDGDLELIYPIRGGGALAGLNNIYDDRDIAFRVHPYGPWTFDQRRDIPAFRRIVSAGLYGNEKPPGYEVTKGTLNEFRLVLGPGQSLHWGFQESRIGFMTSRENQLKFMGHARPGIDLEKAQYFTVGEFEWNADFATIALADLQLTSGLLALEQELRKGLVVQDGELSGRLLAQYLARYPAFAGRIDADVSLPESSRLVVEVHLGKDNSVEFLREGPFDGVVSFDLAPELKIFKRPWQNPVVEIRLERSSPDIQPILRAANATFDVQFNPLMLPVVERGANRLEVRGKTRGTPDMRVEVEWLTYTEPLAPEPPVLVFPPDGAQLPDPAFAFRWEPSAGRDDRKVQNYFIEINDRPDFTGWPIGEFRRYTPTEADGDPTQFQPFAPELFRPGQTYYWRVRAADSKALHSDWSEVRSFTTFAPPMVRDIRIDAGRGELTLAWEPVEGAVSYEVHGSNVHGFHASAESLRLPEHGVLDPTLLATTQETEFLLVEDYVADQPVFAHYRIVPVNAEGGRGEPSAQVHMTIGAPFLLRESSDRVRVAAVSSRGPFEYRPTPNRAYTPGFFEAEESTIKVLQSPDGASPIDGEKYTYRLTDSASGKFIVRIGTDDGTQDYELPLPR
ncbi:fibronectin type III domain-containing protein [bacterium]|nr:fibronectin type III domain-containing protein [bacterium]